MTAPALGTRRRREGGQALAEFALVLPVLLLLTLGVLDGGRLFSAQVALTAAAREAAVFASMSEQYLQWCREASGGGSPAPSIACPAGTTAARFAPDPDNIAARIHAEATGLNVAAINIDPPRCDAVACSESSGSAQNVTIVIRYPMPLFTPLLSVILGNPVQITAQATARIVR